jgi:hypothetical protein
MTGQPGRSGGKREGVGRPPGGSGGRDRPMCSRSRNTPTPTTAYVLIGSTVPAKHRSRFSLNSSATLPPWRSSRTATNRADLSIAAENSARRSKSSAMHCQRSRQLARPIRAQRPDFSAAQRMNVIEPALGTGRASTRATRRSTSTFTLTATASGLSCHLISPHLENNPEQTDKPLSSQKFFMLLAPVI